jgi:hypothetical protein
VTGRGPHILCILLSFTTTKSQKRKMGVYNCLVSRLERPQNRSQCKSLTHTHKHRVLPVRPRYRPLYRPLWTQVIGLMDRVNMVEFHSKCWSKRLWCGTNNAKIPKNLQSSQKPHHGHTDKYAICVPGVATPADFVYALACEKVEQWMDTWVVDCGGRTVPKQVSVQMPDSPPKTQNTTGPDYQEVSPKQLPQKKTLVQKKHEK